MARQFLLLALLLSPLSALAVERLLYAGSSTVGKFIADATVVYRDVIFSVSTLGESAYGETCVQAGRCDLGGVAREVDLADFEPGVSKTLIGWDRISVIVHRESPAEALSLEQLQKIYSGEIDNWSQLGFPDQPLKAYTVKPNSATFQVFRDQVLDGRPYRGVESVPFDAKMTFQVARNKGAIGIISAAFSRRVDAVKLLAVEGELPTPENNNYPLSRPLHLLLPTNAKPEARRFVDWVISEAGQQVVKRRFSGIE